MKTALSVWRDVTNASPNEAELLWHTTITNVLYADDTLPWKRSEENFHLHLQFIRFLVSLPVDGVELIVSRAKGASTLTSYCQSAVINGWLDQSYDPKSGKRIIRPSDKLDRLLVLTSITFKAAA